MPLIRPEVGCDPGDLVAAGEYSPVRLPRPRAADFFADWERVTGSGRTRSPIPVTTPRSPAVAPWSCHLARQDQQTCISREGGPGASDKSSDNGLRQRQTERDATRHRDPSELR
jgi:hypothetical protein